MDAAPAKPVYNEETPPTTVVEAPKTEVPAPEKPQIPDTKPADAPKEDLRKVHEAKIDYLAKLHNISPAEIQVSGDQLVYPHGDHSHRLLLADIQLPSEVATNPETPAIDTNVDLEEEFEKELKALAAAFHVEPGNILVENGMMKVPHGDHTHDYPIKSKGWQAYLANKIDPITDVFVAGGLNRQVVSKRLDELKALAAKRFEDNSRQLGRINRVLDDYRDHNVAWGSNSTEGFLAALATFEKEKILVGTNEPVATPPRPAVDTVTITKGSLMDKLDLLKEVAKESKDDYFNYLSEINNLKESVGYSHTSELVSLKERIEQLEAKIRRSLVKTSEEITYEAQLSTVRYLIKQLDESSHMIKKIQFLNQLDDLETKTNAKDLSALESQVRTLLSPSEATSPTTTPENGAGDQASNQAQTLAQRLEALHQTIKSIDESAHFMKKYTFMNAYQTVDEAAADPAKQEELLLQLKNQVDEFLASLNPVAPVAEEPVVEKETMAVLNERIYQKIRTIDEDKYLLKRMAFLQDYYGLTEDEAKRETAIALEAQVDAFLASVTKQPEANTETTPVAPATNPQDQANYDQLVYFIEANQGDSRLTTEQQADITRLFNQAVALKENQDIKTANNTLQAAKNIIMTTFKADKE
ncbi:hypothetical protein [Granulicatella seriolae]|uniref:Uncharacterized protein n=1 Tax=Granulicatella seriolae TaxID=2967226 RepID=A0ABT1WQU4_9LACT|nr:hypothetical protein [Granulicatella seriolae]